MARPLRNYSVFSVASGCICFGTLPDIWSGASTAPTQAIPTPPPLTGGTIIANKLEYNVPAKNGTWISFQLVDVVTGDVRGWFVCHADTGPEQELAKILCVSGSPYEEDGGSSMNDEKTRAAGILVINRYDWGYNGRRAEDVGEISEEVQAGSESAGLVDYNHAKDQALEWQKQTPSERGPSETGVWMHIPVGEYMFGRFGFDDEHTSARSFLFFTAYTDFTRTALAGHTLSLRKPETHEERFERRLREGYDFSGLETLRRHLKAWRDPNIRRFGPSPPKADEWLGPYNKSEYIFQAHDIKALQSKISKEAVEAPNAQIAILIEPWDAQILDLVNELALSYLEHTIVPHMSKDDDLLTVAKCLFPAHEVDGRKNTLPRVLSERFIQSNQQPVEGLDGVSCERHIYNFLTKRRENTSAGVNDNFCAGVFRVLVYLVSEVLEIAWNYARTTYCSRILPCDIRLAVYNDPELRSELGLSRLFWTGHE
ncbi:hypothetical protein FALCPG4_012610 [Fusarium falciforme]